MPSSTSASEKLLNQHVCFQTSSPHSSWNPSSSNIMLQAPFIPRSIETQVSFVYFCISATQPSLLHPKLVVFSKFTLAIWNKSLDKKPFKPPCCHVWLNHFISHLLNMFCTSISAPHTAPNSQTPFHPTFLKTFIAKRQSCLNISTSQSVSSQLLVLAAKCVSTSLRYSPPSCPTFWKPIFTPNYIEPVFSPSFFEPSSFTCHHVAPCVIETFLSPKMLELRSAIHLKVLWIPFFRKVFIHKYSIYI